MLKKLMLPVFLSVLLLFGNTYALIASEHDEAPVGEEHFMLPDEDEPQSDAAELDSLADYEEVEIELNARLDGQYNILSDFTDRLAFRRGETPIIITGIIEGAIFFGFDQDIHENLKAEILSLPGIDEELIDFHNLTINWSGPRRLSEAEQKATQHEVIDLSDPLVARNLGELRMGSLVRLYGADWTVGPPTNNLGSGFYTANHGVLLDGDGVFVRGTTPSVGYVDNWVVGSAGDASRVRFTSSWIWVGHNLSNLRGSMPREGSRVTALGGVSGNISGTIYANDLTVRGMHDPYGRPVVLNNMTMVVGMRARPGDSGAALISGTSAVGIMSFGGYDPGVGDYVFFTPIRNLPF